MSKWSVIFLITLLLPFPSEAQSKAGYYDHDSVARALPEHERLEHELVLERQRLEHAVIVLQKKLEHLYKYGIPHGVHLDSLQKKTMEDSINDLSNRIQNFQGFAEASLRLKQEASQKILNERVLALTSSFCREKNIAALGRKSAVIYCDGCINYTKAIIAYAQTINQGR